MTVKPLQWRTLVNGPANAHRVADGRYPGWEYHLVRIEGVTPTWIASFVDTYPSHAAKPRDLYEGPSFTEARKAAIDHHKRPGVV